MKCRDFALTIIEISNTKINSFDFYFYYKYSDREQAEMQIKILKLYAKSLMKLFKNI